MKTYFSIIALMLLSIVSSAQIYTKRLALVIGNSDYQNGGSLPNPVNDANAISISLQSVGFEVMKYQNVTQKEMKQAINAFGQKLKGYEVGLFYYAGHGIQNKGMNYMIPIEADLQSEEQVEFDCVAADRVLAYMDAAQAKVNVIIMDACRNNPFERSWHRSTAGNGLAMMNAPTGSLIAYATAPGRVASDGAGSNGLYTSALLKYLGDPKLSIEQVFKRVRTEVTEKSSGAQVPWETTSLTGDDFYFATSTVSKGTITTQQSTVAENKIAVTKRNFNDVSEVNKTKSKEKVAEGHTFYSENPTKSIQLYTEAITLNPYNDEAYYWRGSERYSLKQYKEAIIDYSKAVEINPNYEEAYYYRALSNYNLELVKESLVDFDKAIELNPDVASMHYWRGQAYYKQDMFNEALADYSTSIEINKNDGYSYGARGHCFYMLGKYKEARIDYTKAITMMPESASNYWYWRGICSYNMDLPQESFQDFELFLENNPNDSYALLMSGHCQYILEDYPKAISFYTKAIQTKSDYKEGFYWRARAYFNSNQLNNSLQDINKALQLDPKNETYLNFKKENFK